ncbi:MAG: hypothetical protein WC544_03845 [Patescibacteria group bacterium]
MSRNASILIVVILVVIIAGLLGWYFLKETPTNENLNKTVNSINSVTITRPPAKTVWIMEGSFNPSVVTIATGETVTWVNKDDAQRQVQADPHPSGTSLPALMSDPLSIDGTYSFTFTDAGEYTYHDHLNPIKSGKIIVK